MPTDTRLPLEPFVISIPDEQLTDLVDRLRMTRWPSDDGNDDWSYGVSKAYLAELVDYWINDFDWRKAESTINAFTHYRVTIDDVPVHFMHKPGKGPKPIPLILTHGWPWTFWHWSRVVDQLADPAAYGGDPADAFDVIVPSLPGFGFSTPLRRPDLNFWKVADLWHTLMTETLGHRKYAAGGADMGALVTGQLGHKYADELYGIHLGHALLLDMFNGDRGWDVTGGRMIPPGIPDAIREQILAYTHRYAAHIAVQVLDPQTLTYGLSDSPAGLLAWILKRLMAWSDCHGDVETVFSKDDILTTATIFWANDAIGTSMRAYANAARYPWQPSHDRTPIIEAPTGMTFLGFENPPGVSTENRVQAFKNSERAPWYNLVNLNAHEQGGHFVPWENPQAWIADIRQTFCGLR